MKPGLLCKGDAETDAERKPSPYERFFRTFLGLWPSLYLDEAGGSLDEPRDDPGRDLLLLPSTMSPPGTPKSARLLIARSFPLLLGFPSLEKSL